MKRVILLILMVNIFFFNGKVCPSDINFRNKGLDNLVQVIDLDWGMNIEEIKNYFYGGIYKSTDEKAREIGHYIVAAQLYNRNSKIVFYDFNESRLWGNMPMRRIYIEINDEDDGNDISKKIVNSIYDNYNEFLILSENNTSKYNLQIYNYFSVQKGLDIRISQMESSTGIKNLQIILIPSIHTKGLSEEEINKMLEKRNRAK